MKPKTTLNLLKDFFSDIIKKIVLFLAPFFKTKSWAKPSEISKTQPLVFYSTLTFYKTVFQITIGKTNKSENFNSVPLREKYYYSLQISFF